MAECIGENSRLELTPLKISDPEEPIWIYTQISLIRAPEEKSTRYATLASPDVKAVLDNLTQLLSGQADEVKVRSIDGDFEFQARRRDDGAIKISVAIGEPSQSKQSKLEFVSGPANINEFAGSLRDEHQKVLKSGRSPR